MICTKTGSKWQRYRLKLGRQWHEQVSNTGIRPLTLARTVKGGKTDFHTATRRQRVCRQNHKNSRDSWTTGKTSGENRYTVEKIPFEALNKFQAEKTNRGSANLPRISQINRFWLVSVNVNQIRISCFYLSTLSWIIILVVHARLPPLRWMSAHESYLKIYHDLFSSRTFLHSIYINPLISFGATNFSSWKSCHIFTYLFINGSFNNAISSFNYIMWNCR